jgi:isochorismate pyruvate lyase
MHDRTPDLPNASEQPATRRPDASGGPSALDRRGSSQLPHAGDLAAIRDQIDVLDRRLVGLLAERGRLVGGVVRYKRAHHMAVVDRGREDEMLARIAEVAKEEGVDPRVAQQVLRTIIDGFTLLEVEELGPDT